MRKILLAALVLFLFAPPVLAAEKVVLETSLGDITLELYEEKAPETVRNFLRYVDDGFYAGTVFHRVIPGFMIQGGGFDSSLKKKETRAPIQNEAKNGLKNERGTIAMARTAAPHSATSQFFINHADNPRLDYPSFDGWGYAVFGKVVEGLEVVDRIAAVPTEHRNALFQNLPREQVVIKKARRLKE